ncbi:Uncharacterised protein [Mycoplasmopsis synoviae]|uniref:Uncharacterized protein n=1 Tax=Mycoplasmopsis synoviae TaxID=2109 RepID=A0A3B0P9Q4_MYCSY|nr:Uncharacterised protein [Mycoplasmopsis synoviae]
MKVNFTFLNLSAPSFLVSCSDKEAQFAALSNHFLIFLSFSSEFCPQVLSKSVSTILGINPSQYSANILGHVFCFIIIIEFVVILVELDLFELILIQKLNLMHLDSHQFVQFLVVEYR